MTYRMGAHTSSDDPTRYRLETELQTWSAKDPIARYRAWLKEQGMLDDAAAATINKEVEASVRTIRDRLGSMAPPAAGEAIFGRVYGQPPDSFREEREEFEASLEGT